MGLGLFPTIVNQARSREAIGLLNMLNYYGFTLGDWHFLTEDEKLWYKTAWNHYASDLNAKAQMAEQEAKRHKPQRSRH